MQSKHLDSATGRHEQVRAARTRRLLWLIGPAAAAGLFITGCRVHEGGLGGKPGPVGPSSEIVPPASDAARPPIDPPPATPQKPDAAATMAEAAPPVTPTPPADAAPRPVDAMVADTAPATSPPDAVVAPPIDPAPPARDICAPRLGLTAESRMRLPAADDFAFDNEGHLVLFQNRDVVRVLSETQTLTLVRNIVGFGNGGALRVLPDGDFVIADPRRDHVLRVGPDERRNQGMEVQVASPQRLAPVPDVPGSFYVTSDLSRLYLVNATGTGQAQLLDQLDARPGGIAVDAKNRKLYVGAVTRNAVVAYDIGAGGKLGPRTTVLTQVTQPTALAVDSCGGLYIAGANGGALRRMAPGATTAAIVGDFNGPDITTLEFGSGKHGWSDQSLFGLDTFRGTLYEMRVIRQ